jgi:hypothetical protein
MHKEEAAMRAGLIALALAITLASPVAAADQVTFKGSLTATATITPLVPPFAAVVLEGEGHATQLGAFTFEYAHVVNQATRIGAGTYVFTAANGDTLTADINGQATLVAPGVLTVAETATITGRFAGATGTFAIERVFYLTTLETVGTFEGTISTPGGG